MVKEDNNKSKIDALTDNMISSIKIHDDLDKKFVRRIRLMSEIKKKYDFVAKDEKSVESEYFCAGFVEGADWRINSVWHPANEEPIKHICLLLIEDNNGEFDLGYTFDPYKTRRWAYVKDLIPNKED